MTALHSGDLLARPSDRVDDRPMLARRLGRAGYETTAVVTHPYLLRDADVRASFDRVDTQLAERASQPRAATAEGVTDRILAALAGPERARFVWGHYFDAHAPYVRSDNEVVAGPAIAAYAAEVRRVDQAIGRLARALAARPDRDRIVLFVTADHAESFGEHGAATHGQDLHEEALRIPMLVWSPGRDPRAFGAEVLPESTVEIARYLVGMVVVAPPLPSRMMRLARAPLDDDDQLAVTTRDGWKLIVHRTLNYAELYHLPTDPTEETDLALVEPARVEVLGAALAELHAQVEAERQPARSASSRR